MIIRAVYLSADIDPDNAGELEAFARVLRQVSTPGYHARLKPVGAAPGPAPHPVDVAPNVDDPQEIERGRDALAALMSLWWGGSFALDQAAALVGAHLGGIAAYVAAAGGGSLRAALEALPVDRHPSTAPIHDVPTLLTMLSAAGVVLPRSWYNDDYSQRPPTADGRIER